MPKRLGGDGIEHEHQAQRYAGGIRALSSIYTHLDGSSGKTLQREVVTMRSDGLVKARWYLHRLRAMSAVEVVHRIGEQRKTVDYRRRVAMAVQPSGSLQRRTTAASMTSYLRSEARTNVAELAAFTDRLLSGRLDVLGVSCGSLPIDWHRDPLSGFTWPQTFGLGIDYRHGQSVDPKYAWEINRLLFLVPCAAAAARGYRRSEVQGFLEATIEDWGRASPPGRGIAWSSSIEVALRLLAMTAVVELMESPDHAQLAKSVGTMVASHVDFLERFPSRFSSANNHRVAELVALLVSSSHWAGLDVDVEALEHELVIVATSLFSCDGLGLEQSPTYAAFTLELLSVARDGHDWRSIAGRNAVAAVLNRGYEALSVTIEGSSFIRFGDDDEGRVLGFGLAEPTYIEYLRSLAQGAMPIAAPGLQVFSDGGLTVSRRSGVPALTWTLDHGPLGFGEIAAHGHDDFLHVNVNLDGVPWIVDSGTFRYFGSLEERNYFRSAQAHNGPFIPGAERTRFAGPFNWDRRRPAGKLLKVVNEPELVSVTASHDGYRRGGLDCTTLRTVEDRPERGLRITDWTDRSRPIEVRWLLHPACVAEMIGDRTVRVSRSDSNATMVLSAPSSCRLRLEQPEDRTAWVSLGYGRKVPSSRVVITNLPDRTGAIITQLTFAVKSEPRDEERQ